ncbi:hypothetical protein N665_0567s0009 [Sinapis alba]|nr:hypothetical protein N665_0567s0009 [Sinapis alba]
MVSCLNRLSTCIRRTHTAALGAHNGDNSIGEATLS